MKTAEFKIGSKVNHKNGGYMKNGVVYGHDIISNRIYVRWPQHGNSSMPIDSITIV